MIKCVYCIYDKICVLYRTPMFFPNAAVAIRDLGDEVRRGGTGNALADHPRDYCLHDLGVWDDETGLFDLYPQSRFVVEISALVDPPAPEETGHDHATRVTQDDHAHAVPVRDAARVAAPAERVSLSRPNPQVGMP